MKRITPRVSEATEEFLKTNFKTKSGGAEYILGAFYSAYKRSLAMDIKWKFEINELKLIIDAMGGVALSPQLAGQQLALSVTDSIVLDHTDAEFNVDADKLQDKIKEMPIAELFFLEVFASGFWRQDKIGMDEYLSE